MAPLTVSELELADRLFGPGLSALALQSIAVAERFGVEWYDGRRYLAAGCRPSAADIARMAALQARLEYYGSVIDD